MKVFKYYVDVATMIFRDGQIEPLWVVWCDRRFRVDKVISVRETYSKAGAVESAIDAASGKVSEVFSGKETAGFLNRKCIFPNSLNDLILLHKQKKQTEKARKKSKQTKRKRFSSSLRKPFWLSF